MKTILVGFIMLGFGLGLHASTPIEGTYVVSNFGSDYFFIMNFPKDGLASSGACYKHNEDHSIRKVWSVKGFYAYPEDVRISDDGHWLVRRRRLDGDDVTNSTTLMEIYRDGSLKLKMSVGTFIETKALVLNPSNLVEKEALDFDQEKPFDLLDGFKLRVFLINDGILQPDAKKQAAAEMRRLYVRLDTIDGIRHFVDVESGKTVFKYDKRAGMVQQKPVTPPQKESK